MWVNHVKVKKQSDLSNVFKLVFDISNIILFSAVLSNITSLSTPSATPLGRITAVRERALAPKTQHSRQPAQPNVGPEGGSPKEGPGDKGQGARRAVRTKHIFICPQKSTPAGLFTRRNKHFVYTVETGYMFQWQRMNGWKRNALSLWVIPTLPIINNCEYEYKCKH